MGFEKIFGVSLGSVRLWATLAHRVLYPPFNLVTCGLRRTQNAYYFFIFIYLLSLFFYSYFVQKDSCDQPAYALPQ